MRFHTMVSIAVGLVVLTGCGQASGSAATSSEQPLAPSAHQTSESTSPAAVSPSAVAADKAALAEDLVFTGALSGHVSTATATGECGVRTDANIPTFYGTIDFALADGIHGFRVIWVNYKGSTDLPGAPAPVAIISVAGAPDIIEIGSYNTLSTRVAVAADQRSGTIDGGYIKGVPPPVGLPVTPPPVVGHVSGTWRCA